MQTLFVHCTLLDEVYQLVDPQIWFCWVVFELPVWNLWTEKMGIMSCFLGRRGKGLPCKSKFSRVKQHFLMCLTHADDDVWERERENKRRGESKSCVLGRSWGSLLVLWVFRTELEALTRRWDLGCNLNSMVSFGGGHSTSSSWGCIGFQTGVGMSQFPRNYSI